MIKPDYFELIFRNWVKQVRQEVKGVVAIDGKLMRGQSQCDGENTTGKEGFKLWMVSAWSAANGISLGQMKVDDKSNEITAIPLLINSLKLSGCIVTIDATGCRKDITRTIIEHDANYIIAIKENKKKNYQPAKQIIDDYQDGDEIINRVTRHVSEDAGHGRVETKVCTAVSYETIMEKIFKKKLVVLESVVGIKSERIIVATREYTQKVRYYVTSLDNTKPEEIASGIRQHWSTENNLHWQLDVTFREDYSKKVKNAARNFSVATKMALIILKNEKITKGSMSLKRLKAGWDENYLPQLLQEIIFNASAPGQEMLRIAAAEEYTLVTVADYVLKHTPSNTVSNLNSTRALHDVTRKYGCEYNASAVGEVNAVAKIRATNAITGGEGNGGGIYPESHCGRDDLVGIALFLSHLAHEDKTVNELHATYPPYFIAKNRIDLTPETDSDAILAKVKEMYKDEEVNDINGVKIDFPDKWVHLRKSKPSQLSVYILKLQP